MYIKESIYYTSFSVNDSCMNYLRTFEHFLSHDHELFGIQEHCQIAVRLPVVFR